MHDYLLSILLGIIEGLTEFLPVSSTAHLRIAQGVIGHYFQGQFTPPLDLKNGFWKMYSIVIQLGAILSLLIYFRGRIARFFSTFPHVEHNDRTWKNHPITLVLIAFVCTAGPAFLLSKKIGEHLENFRVFGWSLLIGGIVMWIVDALFGTARPASRHQTERVEEMSVAQSVWIGICQIASAVFPGTSRSMATISAGQLVGMSRSSALEFSFFLSIPTMIAATGYELLRAFHPKHGEPLGSMPANGQEWTILVIGFVVAFIVALGVVAWFLHWVRQRGFTPFAVYRIVLGIAVLIWVMRSGA